ncbi:MAG: glycosyl hydrolase 115 family protein [Janthinobacterium lividum]
MKSFFQNIGFYFTRINRHTSFTGVFLVLMSIVFQQKALANIGDDQYISAKKTNGSFALSAAGKSATISVSATDFPGVIRAAKDLQKDVAAVTDVQPDFSTQKTAVKEVVLIGTLGKNPMIDRLVQQKKLNVSGIAGKWETFLIQVVEKPMPGVERALVIAGSDKRGTIFGIYDVSGQIGVSPWYYWADVPVKKQKDLYVISGRHTQGTPVVKYRGIFINDEAPAFSGWTKAKFGGVNHKMYATMFELILRLKGNYLWPAMWGNAFNDDDSLNRKTANDYGVVMGTSHHEPMDRAQQEWKRYGKGEWNYQKNGEVLRDFWKKGIQNMGSAETIVTVGMRGDGDMPMEEGSNIKLLEQIVADQRKIITDVTHKKITEMPQMWALYKEVQDYYDKGMRVPDDVTLLLCDDNWGDIRKLPKLGAPKRAGGYGIYYHFDYVGDPRNYKWLNTNPISKTWEQMHLANEYGANQVWIVNVGDLKPMEFPISFFLDYAWNPKKIGADQLQKYTEDWAAKQFGLQYATQIAEILSKYSKYNARRKPELLDQHTYSLTNYKEFETVVANYNQLKTEAEQLNIKIPAAYKDAYYELVLHPVQACANLNELYFLVAKNSMYAAQGRAATNDLADRAKKLYAKDAEISRYYNDTLANGKWSHMMDQTHIGYTYWQEPRANKMPEVKQIDVPDAANMGVSVEGSAAWWPNNTDKAILPEFNSSQKSVHYIDVFNRGKTSFDFKVETNASWINVSPQNGKIETEQQLAVSVDWSKAPTGLLQTPITITGANGVKVVVQATIDNKPVNANAKSFVENNGYISIEAAHFTKAVDAGTIRWKVLPDYGRTLDGVTTFPVTAPRNSTDKNSTHLEYQFFASDTGAVKINAYISPSIDFTNSGGLHYAVSVDDEQPQIINIHKKNTEADWRKSVADNIRILTSTHLLKTSGLHVLKFWRVDPGVVLQKLVLDFGGLKDSYLGPPESYRTK